MPWRFRDDAPIYTQLIVQIEELLVSGALSPGQRLPSVRDLAAEAGVNPNTMQRALTELERRGLLYSQRTAGRFVTEDGDMFKSLQERLALAEIQAFLERMEKLGFDRAAVAALIEGTQGEVMT